MPTSLEKYMQLTKVYSVESKISTESQTQAKVLFLHISNIELMLLLDKADPKNNLIMIKIGSK